MTKQQFITKLKSKLRGLSKKDIEERLSFYGEMIDDRIESGLSEEDAIAEIGSADMVASQIIEEISSQKMSEGEKTNKKISALQIVLLVLGSPLWISLLLAGFAVILSIYAVIWSVNAALWAVELPFLIFHFISKYLFIACKWVTLGSVYLTKQCILFIKKFFTGEKSV